MRLTLLSTVVCSAMLLWASSGYTQDTAPDLRQLYNLCSKYPFNSQCEGLETSISPDELNGATGSCAQHHGLSTQFNDCKVMVTNHLITVYLEIELLENRRGALAFEISTDQLFAQTYQMWGNIQRLDFGFIIEPKSELEYRTNFLTVLTSETSGMALKSQLAPPFLYPEPLSQAHHFTLASTSVATINDRVQHLLETKACAGCDLQGANLAEADLKNANLEGANLEGANLEGANLEGAYLVGSNLNQANLTEANLGGANFTLAQLQNALLDRAELNAVNLQAANLQGASLQAADLIAPAFLYQANLENANLRNARLEGANLEAANLAGADLTEADLSDINVDLAEIPGGNYDLGEQLMDLFIGIPIFALTERGVGFNTNLNRANLQGANLTGADLEDASVLDADLSGANLIGAELDDIDLTGSNLCGATMPDDSTSNEGC